MKDRITVIIPVYNEEDYIGECLESVIKANPDEVIVIDDGSTDKTAEIIKQFPVQYVSQNHKGAAKARNLGVKMAKGNIVCMIDADMILDKNYFKKIKKTLKKVPMCDHDESSITTNWISEYNALVRKIRVKKPCIARAMYKKMWIPQEDKDGYYNDGAQLKRLIEKGYKLGMSKGKVKHYETTSFKVFFLMGKSYVNTYNFNWKSFFYTLSALTPFFVFPALYRAIKFRHWKTFFAEWIAKFIMACGMVYGILIKISNFVKDLVTK